MKTLDVDLEYLLQKSGKEIFLKILLTELISKAKKIFELNKQKEALQIILLSKRISEEDKKTALQYYNQL